MCNILSNWDQLLYSVHTNAYLSTCIDYYEHNKLILITEKLF